MIVGWELEHFFFLRARIFSFFSLLSSKAVSTLCDPYPLSSVLLSVILSSEYALIVQQLAPRSFASSVQSSPAMPPPNNLKTSNHQLNPIS